MDGVSRPRAAWLTQERANRCHTGAGWIGWMKEAGFTDARVEHLVGPNSMVIGIK
jgi:hypothetical protein